MSTPAQATAELAFAISTRKLDQIVKKLAAGADPNVMIAQNKGQPSLCALEWAISRFYPLPIVRALIDAGARLDSNQQIKAQMSLMSVALLYCNLPVVALLKDKVPIGEGEWRAVSASCNPEAVAQTLLEKDQKIDEKHPAVALCTGPWGMAFVRLLHSRGMRWAGLAATPSFYAKCAGQNMDIYLEVVRLAHRQDATALASALRKSRTTPLHAFTSVPDLKRLLDNPIVSQWKTEKDSSRRSPVECHLRADRLGCVAALLDGGCPPPAPLDGEDRQAYVVRLMSKRGSPLIDHPVVDRVWAMASAAQLEKAAPQAASRPRVRL